MEQTKQVAIKSKFLIQLTNLEKKVQEITSYEVTEDNINEAQEKVKEWNKIVKEIDNIRVAEKQPYLDGGRDVDSVGKELTLIIQNPINEKIAKIQLIAKKLADAKKIADAEILRIKNIEEGITNNILSFSQKIGTCETTNDLIQIERVINLEKGRKEKYAEFYNDFLNKLSPVYELIAKQKANIVSLEIAKIALDEASKGSDIEALELAENAKIEAEQKKAQTSIEVQEIALDIATAPTEIIVPEIILASAKARRTTWEFEIVDKSELIKKSLHLIDISLNKEAVKISLKTLQESGALKGKTEITIGGIKYFEKIVY